MISLSTSTWNHCFVTLGARASSALGRTMGRESRVGFSFPPARPLAPASLRARMNLWHPGYCFVGSEGNSGSVYRYVISANFKVLWNCFEKQFSEK